MIEATAGERGAQIRTLPILPAVSFSWINPVRIPGLEKHPGTWAWGPGSPTAFWRGGSSSRTWWDQMFVLSLKNWGSDSTLNFIWNSPCCLTVKEKHLNFSLDWKQLDMAIANYIEQHLMKQVKFKAKPKECFKFSQNKSGFGSVLSIFS